MPSLAMAPRRERPKRDATFAARTRTPHAPNSLMQQQQQQQMHQQQQQQQQHVSMDVVIAKVQRQYPGIFTDMIDADSQISRILPHVQYHYVWGVAQFIHSEYGNLLSHERGIGGLLERIAQDLQRNMKEQHMRKDSVGFCVEYIAVLLVKMSHGEALHAAAPVTMEQQGEENEMLENVFSRLVPREPLSICEMQQLLRAFLVVCKVKRGSFASTSLCSFYDLYSSFMVFLTTGLDSLKTVKNRRQFDIKKLMELTKEAAAELFGADPSSTDMLRMQDFDRGIDVEAAIKSLHDLHDNIILRAVRIMCRNNLQASTIHRSILEDIVHVCITVLGSSMRIIRRFVESSDGDCRYILGTMQLSISTVKIAHTLEEFTSLLGHDDFTKFVEESLQTLYTLLKHCYLGSNLVHRFLEGWNFRTLYLKQSNSDMEEGESKEKQMSNTGGSESIRDQSSVTTGKRFQAEMASNGKNLFDIHDMLLYVLGSDYAEMAIQLLRIIGDAFIIQCDRHLEKKTAVSINERDVGKARADFFVQTVSLVNHAFKKDLLSDAFYLKAVSDIFDLMHRHHSYLPGTNKSLAYVVFDQFAEDTIERLSLLVSNNGQMKDKGLVAALMDLLTRLARLESRVIISRLPSLWFILFKIDHSHTTTSGLEQHIGTLLDAVFNAILSGHMHMNSFVSYFDGLYEYCNHCLVYFSDTDWDPRGSSILHIKSLRESMRRFVYAIPSTQLVTCMEQLADNIKKYSTALRKSSTTPGMQRTASKLVPLILFPLTSFGHHAFVYENCYIGLRNTVVERCMPLVKMLFQKFIGSHNDDQLVASVLQLYYAMRSVSNRSEEFSSDVYLLKPLPSVSIGNKNQKKRKKRRLDEDMLLDFGGGSGKTLGELISQGIINTESKTNLSTMCMLYFVIMQRIYELNQQLMIQRHSLIDKPIENSDASISTQFKMQMGFYKQYFNFIMEEFQKSVSGIQNLTELLDASWNGLVESVTTKQQTTIMLWKLITANFSHILPNLEESNLETVINFALSHATPDQLEHASGVEIREKLSTVAQGMDTITSVTGSFIKDEQILDLESTRSFILRTIFNGLYQSVQHLLVGDETNANARQLLESCENSLFQGSNEGEPHVILENIITDALDGSKHSQIRKCEHQNAEGSASNHDQVHVILLKHLPTSFFDSHDAYVLFCVMQLLDITHINKYGPPLSAANITFKSILRRLMPIMGEKRKLFAESKLLLLHLTQYDMASKIAVDDDSKLRLESNLLEPSLGIYSDMIKSLESSVHDAIIQSQIVSMIQIMRGERNDIGTSTVLPCLNMMYRTLNDRAIAQKKTINIEPLSALISSKVDKEGTPLFVAEMQYIAQQIVDPPAQADNFHFSAHLAEILQLIRIVSNDFKTVASLATAIESNLIEDMILAMLDHMNIGFLHQLPKLSIDKDMWQQICRVMTRLADISSLRIGILNDSPFFDALAERLHITYRKLAEACIHFSSEYQNAGFSVDPWRRQLAEIYRRLISARSINRQRFFTMTFLLNHIHKAIISDRITLSWVNKTMLSEDDAKIVNREGCEKVEQSLLKPILHVSSLMGSLLKFCEARPLLLTRTFFDTIVMRLCEVAQPFSQLLSLINSHDAADNQPIRRLTYEICVLLEKIVHTGEVILYTLRNDAARYTNIRLLGTICSTIASALVPIKSNSSALSKLVITVCNLIRANSKLGFYLSFNAPQVVPTLGHLAHVLFNVVVVGELSQDSDGVGGSTESWTSVGTIAPLFVIETLALLYMTIGLNAAFMQQLDILVMDLLKSLDKNGSGDNVSSSSSNNNNNRINNNMETENNSMDQQMYMLKRQSLDVMFDKGLARLFKKLTPNTLDHINYKLEQAGQANRIQMLRYCVNRAIEINKGLRTKHYDNKQQ